MTVTGLFQLYAPLAGLVMLAFWTGMLSERVKNLQIAVSKLQSDEDHDRGFERLIRLEERVESVDKTLEKFDRTMQGISRQLANLANMKLGYAGAGMGD